MRRLALPAIVLALTAGCGSTQQLGAGAAHVPASVDAFVAVRTSDPHWRAFVRLVAGSVPRVPRGQDEVDVAVVHGRTFVVRSRAAPAHPLAASPRWQEARRAAPGGLRGIGYLGGAETARRLHAIPGQVETAPVSYTSRYRYRMYPLQEATNAVLVYRWGAAWLTRDGIEARARSAGLPVAASHRVHGVEQLVEAYTPMLLDEIPADATSVLDLPLPQGSFENVPALPKELAGLNAYTLDQLFGGETAVYRRRGGEITVVSQPQDAQSALQALAQLGPLRRFHHVFLGGQLVLSTSTDGIARFRGGGPKLAARIDGLPQRVTSVVYEAGSLTGWGTADGADPVFTIRFTSDSR